MITRTLVLVIIAQLTNCGSRPTPWGEQPRELAIVHIDRSLTDETDVRAAYDYAARNVPAPIGAAAREPTFVTYQNLETIGLNTGAMDPLQLSGDTIHCVPTCFSPDALMFDVRLWSAALDLNYGEKIAELPKLNLIAQLQQRAPKNSSQDSIHTELMDRTLRFSTTTYVADAFETESNIISPLIAINKARARVLCSEESEQSGGPTDQAGWQNLAADELRKTLRARAEQLPALPKPAPLASNLAGMTFAHEGYRMYNGYGGELVGPSLDSLAKLSVNAVALVPYTFQRNPRKVGKFHLSKRGGSENDASVRHSIRAAKARGWFTLLKPQIWVGGGSWPGDIEPQTDAEWREWFEAYGYWITHYALLAEEEHVDALCIGTELVRTTLAHPAAWSAIIADIRRVYGGRLTYAANWGEEFEELSFWKDLDAIGLNSYYPLTENLDATQAELDAGAAAWMRMAAEKSRARNKPLWLTEVGFRSVDAAWVNPHAETGDRADNYEAQRKCYAALTKAAAGTPELKAMFVWKWPSYLGRRKRDGRMSGFTPGGKPAAVTLGKFYEDWVPSR